MNIELQYFGSRGTAASRNTGSGTTKENEYGFEVENTEYPTVAFTDKFWKKMLDLRVHNEFEDGDLKEAVDRKISELVDIYDDLAKYDEDLTTLRERLDYLEVTEDEWWAGYHAMADMLNINPPRFSAGTLTTTEEDFYYETKFSSIEEAEEWGKNRGLTHIYDARTGKYRKIGGKNWRK